MSMLSRFASLFSMCAFLLLEPGCGNDAGKAGPSASEVHPGGGGSPGADGGKIGCSVTDVDLPVLPDQLEGFGSPKQSVAKLAGKWVNTEGDTLDVQPSASGVFHKSEGARAGNSAGQPCSADTHLELNSHVALSTKDGRFDEQMDVELLVIGDTASFRADVPLDSVKGTFQANDPNDGVLRWSADFGLPGEGWSLGGSVNLVVPQPSSGSAVGGGQVVYLSPFDMRATP